MKLRTWFFMGIGFITLISLISAWFKFSTRTQGAAQVFPATINRDCAPWDGAAFTVSIPLNGLVMDISVYQSPDIRSPITFSFPDQTGRAGRAITILPVGLPEELSGSVTFQRVEQRSPVEGKFDLVTDTGQQYKGRFIAEWGSEIVYCG